MQGMWTKRLVATVIIAAAATATVSVASAHDAAGNTTGSSVSALTTDPAPAPGDTHWG